MPVRCNGITIYYTTGSMSVDNKVARWRNDYDYVA